MCAEDQAVWMLMFDVTFDANIYETIAQFLVTWLSEKNTDSCICLLRDSVTDEKARNCTIEASFSITYPPPVAY